MICPTFVVVFFFQSKSTKFTEHVTFESLWGLLGARGEHRRGHLPVVIRLVKLSRMTFQKTKLRELGSYTLVFLHRCSTFLFLEFNDDIANHSRTLTTATFLSNKQTNRCVNDTYWCEALSYVFSDVFFDEVSDLMKVLWWLANTSAILRQAQSWDMCLRVQVLGRRGQSQYIYIYIFILCSMLSVLW